jgi:hypothetical protein
MTHDCIERTDDHTSIEGASHDFVTVERLRAMVAEQYAEELLEALADAVAGLSHWRARAQNLLRKIAAAELPEPPK